MTSTQDTSRSPLSAPVSVKHRVRTPSGDVQAVEWPVADAAQDAPTVVLAHGWTLSSASWHPVLEAVLRRRAVRVVAFDQPGHGGSAPVGRAPTVHELGEVLHRVITAVAPAGPLVLAGHSMGGMTVMAYAAEHGDDVRDRVRGVVLVSTAAAVGRRARIPMESLAMGASSRAPRVALGRMLPTRAQTRLLYGSGVEDAVAAPGLQLIRSTPLPTIGRWFTALQSHDERAALAHLDGVPTRILVGAQDRLTPVRLSRELDAAIHASRLTVLPGAGHMLTYEAPDPVADAIVDLLP
ncbi:MAG: alpha/beta hydrolase [Ornithinibacter sp.]